MKDYLRLVADNWQYSIMTVLLMPSTPTGIATPLVEPPCRHSPKALSTTQLAVLAP